MDLVHGLHCRQSAPVGLYQLVPRYIVVPQTWAEGIKGVKKCPYCAEEIQDDAIKCKHCGEFLDGFVPRSVSEEKVPWYFRTSFIVISICCVGPLALPLIWWRPKTSRAWKVGLTIAILVLSWFLWEATQKSIETITQYYDLINGF
jgi:hypothetical protein